MTDESYLDADGQVWVRHDIEPGEIIPAAAFIHRDPDSGCRYGWVKPKS